MSARTRGAVLSQADVEPVELTAEGLESTAPEYLRELKAELAADGYQPATLRASASFPESCSIATQEEADRLRGVVRAASFLGATRVTVSLGDVADESAVEDALAALAERADREGLQFRVDGPVSV